MSVSIGINVTSEATVASSSSCASLKSSPEKIQHKRKRKRRRRIENVVLIDNDESKSNIIIEEASNRTIIESVTALPSTPTLPSLPSQEKIEHKKKRKTRRRRKGIDMIAAKGDTSISLQYNRTESTKHNTTQKVQLETNLYANNDGDNNNATESILSNETLASCDGKDTYEAVASNVLLSQSQPNATNTSTDKEMAQESVGSIKATEKKENKLKNKKKRPPIKKPNASKSTTTSSTGKEGECLRRIKHEWKNAVKSGIAFDWINMKTIRNTNTTNSAYVRIGPFGKNLLRWHFSVSGPANSVYENGIYHGRVLLPKDYPASPPRVQMITPSGRFIPGEDICLSASSYHPETWTPRWTVLSLVDALRLHMLTTANEIGGVLASDEKRRQYAIESRSWKCHGIANHERMVAENIFVLQNLDSDGDDDGNSRGKEANSDENTIALGEVATKDVIKCEKDDFISDEEVIKDSLPRPSVIPHPSVDHERNSSKRTSDKKKIAKKQKKSKDPEGEESNNSIPSVLSSEQEPSIPDSTKNKAKKPKKKSTVTIAADTAAVEDSAQQGIQTINTRKSNKKKKRKKKSTGTSTVESVECFADDVRSKEGKFNEHTSTKKTKRNRKVTDIQVQEKERNILTFVVKRLLVEMLKLPLRVLAILIRILDRLENFMRAILDSI